MKMIAYAWSNGRLQVGKRTPERALAIASGGEKPLRKAISVLARHGYSKGFYLVPGVPEAESDNARLDALIEFRRQVEAYLGRA